MRALPWLARRKAGVCPPTLGLYLLLLALVVAAQVCCSREWCCGALRVHA